jgi:hypothetical protein
MDLAHISMEGRRRRQHVSDRALLFRAVLEISNEVPQLLRSPLHTNCLDIYAVITEIATEKYDAV